MPRSTSDADDADTCLEVEDWLALLAEATAGAARRARAEEHSEADVAIWVSPLHRVVEALAHLEAPDRGLLEPLVAMARWGRRKRRAPEDDD